MFDTADYVNVFRAVYGLLVKNDALDYHHIEEKVPKMATRMRTLMERQLTKDPPFMKKLFEGWRQILRGRPQRWRQVCEGRVMTGSQSAMFREFVKDQVDLMTE